MIRVWSWREPRVVADILDRVSDAVEAGNAELLVLIRYGEEVLGPDRPLAILRQIAEYIRAEDPLLKRNLRYDHAFAIVRIDTFLGLDPSARDAISVKKVVRSAEAAEREVARLNSLNQDRGATYFWTITRLERSEYGEQSG